MNSFDEFLSQQRSGADEILLARLAGFDAAVANWPQVGLRDVAASLGRERVAVIPIRSYAREWRVTVQRSWLRRLDAQVSLNESVLEETSGWLLDADLALDTNGRLWFESQTWVEAETVEDYGVQLALNTLFNRGANEWRPTWTRYDASQHRAQVGKGSTGWSPEVKAEAHGYCRLSAYDSNWLVCLIENRLELVKRGPESPPVPLLDTVFDLAASLL